MDHGITPSDPVLAGMTDEQADFVQEYLCDSADLLGEAIALLMVARRTQAAIIQYDFPTPNMAASLIEDVEEAGRKLLDFGARLRVVASLSGEEEKEQAT